MSFDYVVSSGCSFTYGAELINKNDRFVKLIADFYGANLIDYSRGGFGNETISYKLIDGLLYQIKNKLIDPSKTLVLVNWTYGTRFAFYNSEAKGWFSLFPYRVDKNRFKHRLEREVEAEAAFKNVIERMPSTSSDEIKSCLTIVKKLIHEHYLESDKPDREIPELLQQKIKDLNIKVDTILEYSKSEIENLKNKINEYLSYAIFDSSFDGDRFFSKYVHYSDVAYYFQNHSDPKYLIYHLASTLYHTKTFLERHGFDKYVFTFVCGNTMSILKNGIEDYDLLYEDCYDKEGFGHFKNIANDLDKTKLFNVPFEQFSLKGKYKIGNGGHPLEEAHKAYSKLLLDFVKKRYD